MCFWKKLIICLKNNTSVTLGFRTQGALSISSYVIHVDKLNLVLVAVDGDNHKENQLIMKYSELTP